jgi:glutamate-1-semialdehyde aminotransferase
MTHLLGKELESVFKSAGVEACVVVAGSIFRLFFLSQPPRNYRQAALDSKEKHRWFNLWMQNRGIATRQGGCLSVPMMQEHLDRLIDETKSALQAWPF